MQSILPSAIVTSQWTPIVAVVASVLCALQLVATIKSTFVVQKKHVSDVPKRCKTDDGYKEKVTAYVFVSRSISISGSPFSTKLTAYLRLAGIPHIVKEADFEKAPKNKVPYIDHAGSFFGDSQLIIRYLENTYDVSAMARAALKELKGAKKAFVPFDLLTPTQQGISDCVRLACETELYWALSGIRWAGDCGIGKKETLWEATKAAYFEMIPAFIRGIITAMIRVSVLRDAWGYGLIRHSPEDQLYLASRVVHSLSNLLGDKDFFLGDFPAECDCTAFGALECCLDDSRWPNPLTDMIRRDCPNLVNYVARFRKIVFPDVDPSALMPGSREGGVPIKRK